MTNRHNLPWIVRAMQVGAKIMLVLGILFTIVGLVVSPVARQYIDPYYCLSATVSFFVTFICYNLSNQFVQDHL